MKQGLALETFDPLFTCTAVTTRVDGGYIQTDMIIGFPIVSLGGAIDEWAKSTNRCQVWHLFILQGTILKTIFG